MSRVLALATLALVAAAGCKQGPTSVRVRLAAQSGMSADEITLTVFDRYGKVIDSAKLGGSSKLPGDAEVLISPDAGEARAVAKAWAATSDIGGAAGRVPIIPGVESTLNLTLDLGPMDDSDGDGVPDSIDNCPTVANPDQTARDGGVLGDACRGPDSDGGAGSGGAGGIGGGGAGGMGGTGGGGTGGGGGVVAGAHCGDGNLDAGEQCDQGAANSDDPASNSNCTTQCRMRAPCGTLSGAAGSKIDPATGHCYVSWAGPSNFATAQRACQAQASTLAVITSAAENELVGSVVGSGDTWIGLEITPGASKPYRWVDDEAPTYTAFATGQPDNAAAPEECTSYNKGKGGWQDLDCGFPTSGNLIASPAMALPYVCEHSCGNGIVDPGEECDPPGSATCTTNCKLKRSCTESGGVVSPFNGHCYFLVNNMVEYAGALAACPAGTHLATLSDLAENEASLLVLGATGPDAWIALRAATNVSQFAWETPSAEPFASRRFHGFLTPEPNNNSAPACGRVTALMGWRDKDCTGTNYATLCERDQ